MERESLVSEQPKSKDDRFRDKSYRSSRRHRGWLIGLTAISLATLGMVVYLMLEKHNFLETTGDNIFSNSSRINVDRPNPEGPDTILTLIDVYGVFGFANYTCEPDGDIQFVSLVPFTNIIGIDDTWYKVILRSSIVNTATDVLYLEDDKITVNLTEPGGYLVHIYIVSTLPIGFNGTLTACAFLEVNSIGLFDVLRRVAPVCHPLSSVGDAETGPLLVTSTFDKFDIDDPSEVNIRYEVASDTPGEVGIIIARLGLTKL